MSQYLFADGIGNIVLTNGIVRVYFDTVSHNEVDGKLNASMSRHCSIAMTPQAFLQASKRMGDMVQAMTSAGVLVAQGEERRSGPARTPETIPVEGKTTVQKKKARKS